MVFRAFQTARQSLASLTSTSFLRGRALSMLAQAPRLLDRASAGLGPRRQSLTGLGPGLPPVSRLRASVPAARPYVTRAGAAVLNKVPVIREAIRVATIQQHALCGDNVDAMHVALADALMYCGVLQKDTTGDGKSRKHLECAITAQDLVNLNNLHGPLRLTVQNSLQPGQGDALYVLHHAMLLVANFVDKNGCRIGICIDGCDFTDNEATRPLHQLAGQRGKPHPDGRLVVDRKDLDDTRDKTGDDPRRGLVRLVDLDQLQQVNEGRYFFHRPQADALPVQVKSTLMTEDHQKLLRDGIEEGTLQVEELSRALRK